MNFTSTDTDTLRRMLLEAGATHIMPAFRHLAAGSIRAKTGPLDLVTDADEAAEIFITARLREAFPGCLVVGEEATATTPSLLDKLAGAELAFVVDPIDGTSNFAAGLPLFGCMVAAVARGEVVASVILDPVTNHATFATRGEGAWQQGEAGPATQLRVAQTVSLRDMTGGVSWRYMPPSMRAAVLPRLGLVAQSFDMRCAAHQYRMLAAGACHFMVFYKLMPWDHLPGWLLHREAGGFAAQFDGTPYRAGQTTGGLICAPDAASWRTLRDGLLAEGGKESHPPLVPGDSIP